MLLFVRVIEDLELINDVATLLSFSLDIIRRMLRSVYRARRTSEDTVHHER